MNDSLDGVAIIGMAGRFPGAKNIHEFWDNLKNGEESVTYFTKEEARACGIDEQLINDPNYVFASGILEDIDLFDAGFFGCTPREAESMDPQQRLFLECCYEALEDGGYAKNNYDYPVGVYAGSNMSYYFLYHLLNKMGIGDDLSIAVGNDKDYLTTRVSYQFNLKGPSINVQTACSTSATAIAMAYEGLLNYHCDMAIAGGSGVKLPQKAGYLYQEGFIGSPDGHTRPFDDNAHGTIFTSVAGTVLMKRLEDAVRDGDHIYAVIKGMAVNNDGSEKVGFTAPSREGQAEVIAAAQNLAGVNPEDISYIEAHGTGTSLGDPIEVSALTNVFRESTEKKSFCALGSVKGNIGHAISGAGVASIIKTVLALEHKQIPPTINFETPNSKIDFENSPFYVNTELCEWESKGKPRIAGVSSFGFGGTNVHAVIEEAPELESSPDTRQWKLVTVSARSATTLNNMCNNLVAHFKNNPEINFADAVYTLNVGRKEFEHRCAIVCSSLEDAVTLLEVREGQNVISGSAQSNELENTAGNDLIKSGNLSSKETLISLAKLWVNGAPIDWELFYEDQKRLRIPLPTYPFERKRYWVEQYNPKDSKLGSGKEAAVSRDFNDWTYLPSWKRAASLPFDSKKIVKGEVWMIFADEIGLGDKIRELLEKEDIEIIEVARGNTYKKINAKQYLINADNKQDYSLLINDIVDSGSKIKKVLHLWSVTDSNKNISRIEFSEQCQKNGFFSMMYLAQAFGNKGLGDRLRIVAVSNNVHFISNEQELQPEKASIIGPCKVIPREYINISCQSIDVILPQLDSAAGNKLVEAIVAEVSAKEPEFIVALRGSSRWLQTYERFKVEAPEETSFVKGGATYLITGGLGGLGLAIAEYMSKIAKVNFVLTRRSAFPEKEKWADWLAEHSKSDKTSIKIKQLIELEKSGSRVMTANVDTSDLDQMKKLVECAELEFGTISGVIHAAGIADNGLISDKKTEVAEEVLTPKVKGTLVIDEIFKNRSLEYTVLFSSSSAVLGNGGFIDYCAANTFLDVYAQYKNSNPQNYTVAINWDEWAEVGMAAESNVGDRIKNKVTLKEGLILLDRIVSTKSSAQIIVSSGDFLGMLENIHDFMLDMIEGRVLKEQDVQVKNNRPDLQMPYIEPSNQTEEYIAEILQNLLGIYPVGIDDDFFELGGNSLLAIKMEVEMEKKNLIVQTSDILRLGTIRKLASLILHGEAIEPLTNEISETGCGQNVQAPETIQVDSQNRKLVDEVQPFNDIFYKNCFYNAAFPLLRYYNKRILTFLVNDIILYTKNNQNEGVYINTEYVSIKPVEQILKEEGLEYQLKNKCDNVVEDIIHAISNDRLPIVYIDCFYEPLKISSYMKEHSDHSILVYGYDNDKQVFNVIEHIHRDNLTYEKRILNYEDMRNSYEGYMRNFYRDTDNMSYIEIYGDRVKNEANSNTDGDVEKYKHILVENTDTQKNLIYERLESLKMFIEKYKEMAIDETLLGQNSLELLNNFNDINNAKNVEKYTVQQLFGVETEYFELINKICQNWGFVRNVLAKYQYTSVYKKGDFESSIKKLSDIYETELKYIDKILSNR